MSKEKNVFVELIKGTENEYVIKDKNKIILGRFIILELDKENKRCNIRFKFYRDEDYELMVDSIELILTAAFKNPSVHKVNFYTSDKVWLTPFLDEGFSLEGILKDNIWANGEFSNELILGITRNEYNSMYLNNNFVELYGERLIIRNLTPDDAKELSGYYLKNKDHLQKYEPMRDAEFFTERNQKLILSESYCQLIKGVTFDLGIFKDDKLIGKIKLTNIVYGVFKNAFIGYSIDYENQNKGYMTEAVNLVLDFAKNELGLHRIEASILEDNIKSKSVLEKCGFKQIGLNENYLFINNKWRNHYTYYRLL